MADTQAESQVDQPGPTDWGPGWHSILMWLLLGFGALLVLCASALGEEAVMNCGPSGNCSWRPEAAQQAALVLRCLGGMMFAAGLVERLILGLRGLGPSAA